MSNNALFKVLSHLDEPLRILSLTIDELIIAVIGVMMLVLTDYKITTITIGGLLFTGLRRAKRGGGPKVLLLMLYWYLPSGLTQFFLSKLPPSYKRVWRA